MLLACDAAVMSDGQNVGLPLEYSDLTIEGWREGFKKISFTKLLQREAGLGLADAKHVTDEVLENKPIRVRVPTNRRDSFIDEAKALGIADIRVGIGGGGFAGITSEQIALRYPCPCCGYVMFDEPPGSYDICDVCGWEDDEVQLRWPDVRGGANSPSLIDAQANFAEFGSSEERRLPSSRPPTPSDHRETGWRPIDLALDRFEPRGTSEGEHPSDSTAFYWWRPTFWRLHRQP